MNRIRLPRSRSTGATVALAVLFSGVLLVSPAQAVSYDPITGTGSTWSQNAFDQWRKNVALNYGMTVNYSGVGSSAGRRDFVAGNVDFAVSEIPFQTRPEDNSAPEVPTRGYAYIPAVAGGTVFAYNLKIGGVRVSNLRLSGEVITKIFTGVITKWNDPAIQTDNPGLAMPDKSIVPVVRSDGSGSTAQFTLWMSKQHPDLWNAFCTKVGRSAPCGLTSQYPTFGNAKAQSGSSGVAGYVSQDYGDGAITYVEHSYALAAGLPVAKVLNAGGYYVEPTADSVAVALLQAQIKTDVPVTSPDYLTQILDGVYNNADVRSYPLSSYSYMIVPTAVGGVFTEKKGLTLGAFANYMLCEGQQQAEALGYAPLPMNLVLAGFDQIKRVPGADVSGVDINKCNNPTFKAGDSLSSNVLLRTAAMPSEADRNTSSVSLTKTTQSSIDLNVGVVSVNDGALSLNVPLAAAAVFAAPKLENGISITRGTLPEITVQDNRLVSRPGWTLGMDVSDFVNTVDSSVTIDKEFLAVQPLLITSKTQAQGQTLGAAQTAGSATYPRIFAETAGYDSSSGATALLVGTTVLNGNLLFSAPPEKPVGSYRSTATLTLVSK